MKKDKKREKKGFTLIELLAVILVLSIITLIAVTTVVNIVEYTRKQANLRSLESHIYNMRTFIGEANLKNIISDGEYTFEELELEDYPLEDKTRCASYTIKNSILYEASDCLINNIDYCFINDKPLICKDLAPSFVLKLGYGIFKTYVDLDDTTGEEYENRRRLASQNFYPVDHRNYNIEITKNYGLCFYEYDANKNYIGTHILFTENGVYTPSKNAKYYKFTLRAPSSKEKTMSPGQWGSAFNSHTVEGQIYVGGGR